MKPLLSTERCELHRLKKSDSHHIKKLYDNEQVRKYLGGTVNEESFKQRFHDMIHSPNKEYHWTIFNKSSQEFVGMVFLDTYHDGIHTEIGYQFLPEFWGRGIAREVINKVLHYGIHTMQLDRVMAETQSQNKASCKLLLSVGMRLENKIQRFGNEQSVFAFSGS
ncbi:GNAT family N-acetyltransferase [Rossellomorea vietnamensis]|uniref:GNAT family N-acetyltransferase n=1 Tax=Rossellomorea vietnamensis TaxID=218284 RepID=UPI001CCA1FE0|nr:GNAT family N-acetyltransferase [Rossellomorea vietnamensis]MCA0147235.1 GNAT family N-acetyltransferase [Rossellomorea vietnamensis]